VSQYNWHFHIAKTIADRAACSLFGPVAPVGEGGLHVLKANLEHVDQVTGPVNSGHKSGSVVDICGVGQLVDHEMCDIRKGDPRHELAGVDVFTVSRGAGFRAVGQPWALRT
jgi:hypothetical protein